MAIAQIPAQQDVQDIEPIGAEFNTGGLGISGGVDFTHAYYFRGIIQEDDGLIVQPYLEVGIDVAETDDVTVGAAVGIWNSIHDEDTGSDGDGPESWYESDVYAGLSFGFGDFSADVIYTIYTSPNNAFSTVQELGFGLAYAGAIEGDGVNFTYEVGAGLFFELDNSAFGPEEGIYAELGFTPGFEIEFSDTFSLPIEVPFVVGLNVDDYYDDGTDDDTFGYVSVAVATSIPLEFIPEKYGAWSASASLKYLYLASDLLEDANDGDESEFIGTVGISFEY
ncbi:MAG: hypothetical protein ACFCVE_11210 [Phycisphaerae bacterium]